MVKHSKHGRSVPPSAPAERMPMKKHMMKAMPKMAGSGAVRTPPPARKAFGKRK